MTPAVNSAVSAYRAKQEVINMNETKKLIQQQRAKSAADTDNVTIQNKILRDTMDNIINSTNSSAKQAVTGFDNLDEFQRSKAGKYTDWIGRALKALNPFLQNNPLQRR